MALLQPVTSLQSSCIRHFALALSPDSSRVKRLPVRLIHRILRLRDEMKIFINCCSSFHHFARPSREIQLEEILVSDECTVDWKKSTKRFLDNFEDEQAFRFAAANALEEECSLIWETFDETERRYFIASVDSPMSQFSASISVAVREQIGENNSRCAEDVLWESLYSGNPYALNYWLQKAPKGRFQVDCFHLLSQIVSEKHYHMIDVLCDGFLDGKILPPQTFKDISSATYLLTFSPPHWEAKAKKMADTLYSVLAKWD